MGKEKLFDCAVYIKVSNTNVDQFTLRMSLYSVGRSKKHQLVGQVLFPLRHSDLREAAGKVLWRDLEGESDLVDKCRCLHPKSYFRVVLLNCVD